MVTLNLVNVDTAIHLVGQDAATKVQIHKIEREERGNMDYNKLVTQPPAGECNPCKKNLKPYNGFICQ